MFNHQSDKDGEKRWAREENAFIVTTLKWSKG
jgi:hypothetical protein